MNKKYIIAALFLANSISNSLYATPYVVNVTNNTKLGAVALQMYCNGGKTVENISVTGTTSINLDTDEVCQIKNSNQIFASLKQDATYFTIQETPQIGAAWQNLEVSYSNGAVVLGSFFTAQLSYQGDCKGDGSDGITCALPNEPIVISMTLTGGTAPTPTPVPNYVKNMGNWDPTFQYAPTYSPTIYPMVTYTNGQQYVACWFVTIGKDIPSQGGPWKLYNADQNVCNP